MERQYNDGKPLTKDADARNRRAVVAVELGQRPGICGARSIPQ